MCDCFSVIRCLDCGNKYHNGFISTIKTSYNAKTVTHDRLLWEAVVIFISTIKTSYNAKTVTNNRLLWEAVVIDCGNKYHNGFP
jgi:hypothetical protein